jgi:hypothetical protein
MAQHTVSEVADGEHIPVSCEELQGDVRRSLTDHEMDSDESLEDDSPC